MKERIISNARIESTALGQQDGQCFSALLMLDFSGTGQGFGGYAIDSYDKVLKRRVGTAWGLEFIARILATVGVEKWEDLKGKYIRVDHEEFGSIFRIGHILEGKWFDPKADLDFLKEKRLL